MSSRRRTRRPTAEPLPADVLTVGDLTRRIRACLEDAFDHVTVVGELSNVARPRSGHVYFTLKDDSSQVRCALFRSAARGLAFEPEDGLAS